MLTSIVRRMVLLTLPSLDLSCRVDQAALGVVLKVFRFGPFLAMGSILSSIFRLDAISFSLWFMLSRCCSLLIL